MRLLLFLCYNSHDFGGTLLPDPLPSVDETSLFARTKESNEETREEGVTPLTLWDTPCLPTRVGVVPYLGPNAGVSVSPGSRTRREDLVRKLGKTPTFFIPNP